MHPALVFGIVIGGALVLWGGYEAVNTIYEWHQDRQEQKSYEEYVKAHAEKGRLVPVTLFENHDEDDEEDDEPLGVWQKRDSMHSQLRHRNNHSSSEEPSHQYELLEMQRSLSSRRSLLERESALLQQQEAEFERRRMILRSKGNNITGVFKDDSDLEQNPFEFVQSSHSSIYQKQTKNPFDDPAPTAITKEEDLQERGATHKRYPSSDDGSWSDFMMEDSADDHITKGNFIS